MLPITRNIIPGFNSQFTLADGHFAIVSKVVCRIGLAAILMLTAMSAPCQAQWTWKKNGGSHNWNAGGSWDGPAGSPNSLTAIANINNNISSNQTIVLQTSASAGTINIGDSTLSSGVYQTFTIQPETGTQTLTLGSGGIFSSNSVNTINSNMILGADTSIQHANASGSMNINGNVDMGTRILTVAGSGNTFIAGAMTGTGSLTKTGAGNLTLTGTNNYSGGTTVSAGTLTGSSTSLQGAIVNNGSVVFNQAAAGSYAGAMNGNGSLTKTGAGNLTLSGNNSYNGGTTVSAGTLTGTTTSVQGAIVNSATVVFNQSINGTYSGIMQGTGQLIKTGTGNVTLSGSNTYGGGTTINAGSLTGTTSSIQGAVTNNSAIVFNQSTSGTYAGVIGGSGTLTKSGSGTVTFSSGQNYLGDTFVTGGTLKLDNGTSLASSQIQVDSGAVLDVSQFTSFALNAGQTLTGAGQVVGSLTQSAGSIISPGSSPGTLNFTGDVTLLGGSSYLWEINDATGVAGGPTGWDLFTTSGSLIIGTDSSDPYLITVESLLPSNSAGDVINFDPFATYEWEIAFASNGITGFDSSAFVVDASGFTNDLSAVTSYTFSILQNGNSLYLRYAAVPEPSALLVIGLFAMGVALTRKPRRRR